MSLPTQYWHCCVKLQGDKKYAVENDLSWDKLRDCVLTPWHQSSPFTVAGKIVSKNSTIEEIRITQTEQPYRVIADRYNMETSACGINDLATDRRMLPLKQGEDFTFKLLYKGKAAGDTNEQIDLIETICKRISRAAMILGKRSRKDKQPYLVNDEYDVQDLLHAVLRAHLKYSVQENPLPKVAGTGSGRADISIEELGILIELKYVRNPEDQKRVFEEFSQDLVLYSSWPYLKTLYYEPILEFA